MSTQETRIYVPSFTDEDKRVSQVIWRKQLAELGEDKPILKCKVSPESGLEVNALDLNGVIFGHEFGPGSQDPRPFEHMDRLAVASFDRSCLETRCVDPLAQGKPLIPRCLLAKELDEGTQGMLVYDPLLTRNDDFTGIGRFPLFEGHIGNPSLTRAYDVHLFHTPSLFSC